MLNDALLARAGLERLRLPVPGAKLAIVHAAAESIQDPAVGPTLWQALLNWFGELELESEVLEALSIVLLLRNWPHASTSLVQRSITRPSILSDALLSSASGRPLLVSSSWQTAHSDLVPSFFSGKDALDELAAGRIVPPIVHDTLGELELTSRKPFRKQWAYEYQRLTDRLGPQRDGHWTYFADDHEAFVGQFVTRRGHVARSAYLRTLALAVDLWNMPEAYAESQAWIVSPVDLVFLQMPPGNLPPWAGSLRSSKPLTQNDCEGLLRHLAAEAHSGPDGRLLLHLNTALAGDHQFCGEVEMVTIMYDGVAPDADEAFRLHHFLPGRVVIARESGWSFVLGPTPPGVKLPRESEGYLTPALLPAVSDLCGYLHADLLTRIPYLPANYSRELYPVALPRAGGADIKLGDLDIGELAFWNMKWAPTHHHSIGSGCGTALTVAETMRHLLLGDSNLEIRQLWRAKILTREQAYGAWTETVHKGVLGPLR